MSESPRRVPGVNIQWPWSELLLTGEKTVETRSYALPLKYQNEWLALIETPGLYGKTKAGIEKARITGLIRFSSSFLYSSQDEWRKDYVRHLVKEDDPLFGYREDKMKWGWLVSGVQIFDEFLLPPKKRGIVFASSCQLN